MFGIVVGIEFAIAGAGAVILSRRQHKDLVPAWVALIVGVHLFPVGIILRYPMLYVVAALVTIAAPISVKLARSQGIALSAVAGLLTGTILLAAAIVSVAVALATP